MTLLEKIDAVLECLYIHSGEAPNLPKIEAFLKEVPIETGEIVDCLKKLHKENFMYCVSQDGGNINYSYNDNGIYLISFDGKFFWENTGGYVKEKARRNEKSNQEETAKTYQRTQADTLNRLTRWICIASGVAAVYYLLQIVLFFYTLH